LRTLDNKSQDRLIGVDSLNLACEGLLLGREAGGLARRRPPNAITLAVLRRSQGDTSRMPPRCYQVVSSACADPLTDLHLIIQQDDGSSDRGGGRGWPWRWRVAIGPPPSSSGGDPVTKAQLAASGEDPPRRGHVSPSDRPVVKYMTM
jgi:hypothetical protein